MGGLGSGRKSGRFSTGDTWRLDVRWLYREGLLSEGRSSSVTWSRNNKKVADIGIHAHGDYVTLKYRMRRPREEEWKDMEYPVALEWTACHFGGKRPWFLCPICGKRAAVLYGIEVYACRHCLNLAYTCQREGKLDRAIRRREKIKDRLGWNGIIRFKPKGMHWRTYERLEKEYWRLDGAVDADTCERFFRWRSR